MEASRAARAPSFSASASESMPRISAAGSGTSEADPAIRPLDPPSAGNAMSTRSSTLTASPNEARARSESGVAESDAPSSEKSARRRSLPAPAFSGAIVTPRQGERASHSTAANRGSSAAPTARSSSRSAPSSASPRIPPGPNTRRRSSITEISTFDTVERTMSTLPSRSGNGSQAACTSIPGSARTPPPTTQIRRAPAARRRRHPTRFASPVTTTSRPSAYRSRATYAGRRCTAPAKQEASYSKPPSRGPRRSTLFLARVARR